MSKTILITGVAGFIGFHTAKKFLKLGYKIIGIDNLNNYYSVKLKNQRLNILKNSKKFTFFKVDLSEFKKLNKILNTLKFDYVLHLAAQAGVRHSLKKPRDYLQSNIIGYFNLLEILKKKKLKHLILASTSSIYGLSTKNSFQEDHITDRPIQFYAATKKSDEVISYSYSQIYKLPITCTRFFTVYGPFGRPDMAYYSFADKIIQNKKIDIYNYGNQKRDFTYIDDVVNALFKITFKIPNKKNNYYRILNIGKGKPDKLLDFVKYLEKYLGKKAKLNFVKSQVGDVKYTKASIKKTYDLTKYVPKVSLKDGIKSFANWYLKNK